MNHQEFKRGWNGGLPETPCGNGSRLSQTVVQREWIPRIVANYAISDIADIGAGDLNWIKHCDLGCAYRAYDLVPRHPDVTCYNLLTDPLPDADCYMVLWVLNHLPDKMQEAAIGKLKESSARYLIMTYYAGMADCTDLPYIENKILKTRVRESTDSPPIITTTDYEIRLCKL